VVSALVLAPVALAAVWFGAPWFDALTALAAAIMAWEWGRLCGAGRFGASGGLVLAAVLGVVLAAAFDQWRLALLGAACGAVVVLAVSRWRGAPVPALTAVGVLWIAIPCVALLWLARDPAIGRATVLWIFAVVWATDIGAYAVGRTVGGKLLAPRVSPSKTWSGLAGGVISAAIAGWLVAWLVGNASEMVVAVMSAALAVVEQFGDLAESTAKRRFGVKDSSALIPGHGGLLDRVDGLLAVAPVVALLSLLGGSSVLTWR
jgi:phosphatidate cytidylyltransferase